jgi:hypothetical protein
MRSILIAQLEERLANIENSREEIGDKLDVLIKTDRLLEQEEEIVRDALEAYRSLEEI